MLDARFALGAWQSLAVGAPRGGWGARLERGERDADDDREERSVYLPLEDLAEDDVRERAGEEGLTRLDLTDGYTESNRIEE